MSEVKHGWYSEAAAERYGSSIYRTPSGDGVEVTAVSSSAEYPKYEWADKVYMGPVSEYVREGRKGSFPIDPIVESFDEPWMTSWFHGYERGQR